MEPAETPPTSSFRSTLAGLVVVGALVGFGSLLVLPSFVGMLSDEPEVAQGPGFGGKGKAKSKAKAGKSKGAPEVKGKDKRPEAELLVVSPPYERPPAPEGARNVVVVIPSSVRKDHYTPYGGDPALTPFLQEVATDGARFADVISAGPLGRYATAAALTGQIPAVLDLQDPSKGPDSKVLAPEVTTLPELLRDGGWRTYGVTGNFHTNSDTGLAQGFDRYRDAQPVGFAPQARLEGPAAVEIALGFLRDRTPEEQQRPFYLQVNLVDAHGPVRDVPAITEMFQPGPRAVYRAGVHRTDSFVRDLWEGLGQLGYSRDDTFLVVVGDHGEGLEDPPHHGKAHGRYLYESSVAIGWIVQGPGIPANRIVNGLASSTDVMPTVLELVGLQPPPGLEGRSWAAQLRGESDRTTRERAWSDTWFMDVNRASVWTERTACLEDFGSEPDPHDTFGAGCFDRKVDPTFTNVQKDEALLAELVAWRAEVSKHVTAPAKPEPSSEGAADGEEG